MISPRQFEFLLFASRTLPVSDQSQIKETQR